MAPPDQLRLSLPVLRRVSAMILRRYGKAMKTRIAKKSVLWLRFADGSLLCAPVVPECPINPYWNPKNVLDHNVEWFRDQLDSLPAIRGDPDTQPPRTELIFAGKPLEDHMTLRECGLHVGSEVLLVKMPAVLELHMFGYIGEVCVDHGTVCVNPADTINDFKANFPSKPCCWRFIERCRIFKSGLVGNREELEGERTFSDYNIVDGDTIILVSLS